MIVETVQLDKAGRFVVSARMRAALGVKPGDTLVMRVEDDSVRLFNQRRALEEAQAYFNALTKDIPSVVDDFLADRKIDGRDKF